MTYFVKQGKTEGFKSELLHDSFALFNNTGIRRSCGLTKDGWTRNSSMRS